MNDRRIPTTMEIKTFFHCRRCILELPDGISPRDWAQNEVGFTEIGLQVWCRRHNANIIHIDFEGERHPASIGRKPDVN
jgi:hypothetical protein